MVDLDHAGVLECVAVFGMHAPKAVARCTIDGDDEVWLWPRAICVEGDAFVDVRYPSEIVWNWVLDDRNYACIGDLWQGTE